MDVADEFGIPLAQVKDWIENGYFVYRKDQWY
jgi:hypothetical protein